ncbi:T9SS type A sorting domain-containing protein [Hymenobacter sp. BT770]|uniref:T9SS type A sorting domain-containing protein n=1 Tax=Hymenobacter sp. BT770 TaxID=2886942 RepID=UPI001D108CA3|nr:T9SS type A sorting domain-containing protein [Hymenobacter sp. BT770]MCC3154051.1 T9SS type A sorting domain-containing protein [Hymenobacter sp. BT770]MDO3416195.1 T9SS type A sorting domain-containing protein [Hymenobacter sp. BT770]
MKHILPSPMNAFASLPAASLLTRKRWQLLGLFLGLLSPLAGHAQSRTYKVGTANGANYPTIAAALTAIPTILDKDYELQLVDNSYTEDVVLDKKASAVNTLTIRPAANTTTAINGTVTFGSGSTYITLNGNSSNNGTAGRTRALTIRQSDPALPALVFKDDASHNVVREVVLLGSTSSSTSGVVEIGNGITTGNDNNTLTQSFVANANSSQLPTNLLYAANMGRGANDDFTLSDNELFDFTGTAVLVATGNGDRWTISGNSIYNNQSTPPSTAQTGIDFRPGSGANDVTITGNFIGGKAAGASGGIWENTGTQNFRGIVMNCGSSTTLTNVVTSNTVSNVSLTVASSAALTAFEISTGRCELNANTASFLKNSGTSGVNNLVSRATTVLNSFTVSNEQLMVVESGLTTVAGDLNNAGIINHTGGNMLITGNFINSGTFAQTLGDIEIKGNMQNSGQFSCSTGKVRLTGTGPQSVSGGLYFNLEVNGVGPMTFTDDADVFNGIQMINGVLATGPSYRIKLGTSANLTETESSYVLGTIIATRTPNSNTTEQFGGVGLSVQLLPSSAQPGTTKVTRVTGTAPIGVSGRQGILRYFDIAPATTTGVSVNMTFKYFDHELNGIAPANLQFFKSVNGGTTWQNKGMSSLSTGSAVLNGVNDLSYASTTTFSRWTLGDVTNPLPVGLTAFQAERQGRNAVLTWATASEHNNRGFGIEVSLDGKSFKEIGFVEAAGNGNSSSAQSYRFVDAAEGKVGARYYRLRQVDQNEAATFYGPQLLNFDAQVASFAAYPTQFASGFTVALTSPTASSATLRLIDIMGREVWRQEVASGVRQVQPTCAAGSYILTATINGQVLRQRVVKE